MTTSRRPSFVIPWHLESKVALSPYVQMTVELFLMAALIEMEWTQNDTTNEQDHELHAIAQELQTLGKRLFLVMDPSKVESKS